MINKVEICGVNTAKLPTLTQEEKSTLLKRIKEGDMQAREEFIRGNLRLVLRIIQRFYNRGENADDLFQVGCIGLIKAIDNFDSSLGVQFSTYGVPMIVGELRRFLRDNSPMRVSRSLRDTAYKALQVREALTRQKGQEPTVDEIAKELGIPKEDVVFALDAIQDPISLYEPVFHDDGDALYVMDQIRDDKNTNEDWLQHIALGEAMEQLNERERKILYLRFFKGKTQMEVSEEIHISQAQVSRIEKAALKEMRKWL
ncbi:MAG: RNA polymerase sporulation sigma factor SigG [Firmicutes bacterium]|nr:RNA polymerase sporulation sigma factor SigG [Bacillota bacterium]